MAMNKRLSPYELELLIHIYTTPLGFKNSTHPVGSHLNNTLAYFITNKVIKEGDTVNGYAITPLGEAWLRSILVTPLPIKQYVNQLGEVIE